jgi:hypothetical protein
LARRAVTGHIVARHALSGGGKLAGFRLTDGALNRIGRRASACREEQRQAGLGLGRIPMCDSDYLISPQTQLIAGFWHH